MPKDVGEWWSVCVGGGGGLKDASPRKMACPRRLEEAALRLIKMIKSISLKMIINR